MINEKFQVTGMTCAACSAHVEKAAAGVEGVNKVSVSLLMNSMTVEYDTPAQNAQGQETELLPVQALTERRWRIMRHLRYGAGSLRRCVF